MNFIIDRDITLLYHELKDVSLTRNYPQIISGNADISMVLWFLHCEVGNTFLAMS